MNADARTADASRLRFAVIGLGAMGLKHARCIAAHPDAELKAIVEPDPIRAAVDLGCAVYSASSSLIGRIDAAIIAAPTALHATLAAPLLHAGIACLIEKPLVATPDQLRLLVGAASSAVLTVGHIERFNPAICALFNRLRDDEPITGLAARRISGASARVVDIDVVMDLMVHDIDIVLAIKRRPVTKVAAAGNADHAVALLTFDDDTVATVTASRAIPVRIRDLDIATPQRALHLDYISRELTESVAKDGGFAQRALPVDKHDALTSQLSGFIATIRGGVASVSVQDACAVMDVAWRVQKALGL